MNCLYKLKQLYEFSTPVALLLYIVVKASLAARLTHCHDWADPRPCSCQVSRLPFVLNAAISLCHSSLRVYPIPSSSLEVSDVSTNDIMTIITTITYRFSGSIVALWLSAFPRVIVGTSDGLIAANKTSWAIIHHPPHFFSLPGRWQSRSPLWRSLDFFRWRCEEETQK